MYREYITTNHKIGVPEVCFIPLQFPCYITLMGCQNNSFNTDDWCGVYIYRPATNYDHFTGIWFYFLLVSNPPMLAISALRLGCD